VNGSTRSRVRKATKVDRAAFRTAVFERDRGCCVLCGAEAVDAHHILERRLWPPTHGGYLLDNGVALCGPCHIAAEQTRVTPAELRAIAGIQTVLVPDHLYPDQPYDKWGNPYTDHGTRTPGELFFDESVQRILKEAGVLGQFEKYYKHPRIFHLGWSHPHSDDKLLSDLSAFRDQEVVVTLKMDGEQTSMYNDHIHPRAVYPAPHPSRGWVKNFWSRFAHDIPEGYRVCGENLYARHSLAYDDLPDFFMGFGVWDRTRCLSWDESLEWFSLLGIMPVPTLYRGIWNLELIRGLKLDETTQEGYVVRLADSFSMQEAPVSMAKYVRTGHLQTPERWERQWQPNKIGHLK
jgi:hypothetical protein